MSELATLPAAPDGVDVAEQTGPGSAVTDGVGYDPLDALDAPDAPDAPLDGRLQNILDNSQVMADGRIYVGPGDLVETLGPRIAPMADHYTVIIHGNENDVAVNGDHLTPDDLGTLMDHDPNYDKDAVRLFSCSTGATPDGFAQRFADRMEVEVVAPSALAWIDSSGQFGVGKQIGTDIHGDPILENSGEWRTFQPRTDQ